jgi:hypothetical protein
MRRWRGFIGFGWDEKPVFFFFFSPSTKVSKMCMHLAAPPLLLLLPGQLA